MAEDPLHGGEWIRKLMAPLSGGKLDQYTLAAAAVCRSGSTPKILKEFGSCVCEEGDIVSDGDECCADVDVASGKGQIGDQGAGGLTMGLDLAQVDLDYQKFHKYGYVSRYNITCEYLKERFRTPRLLPGHLGCRRTGLGGSHFSRALPYWPPPRLRCWRPVPHLPQTRRN